MVTTKLASPVFSDIGETASHIKHLLQFVDNLCKQTGNLSTKVDLTRKDSNGQLLLVVLIVSGHILVETLVIFTN